MTLELHTHPICCKTMYKILREIGKHRIQVVPGLYSILVRHAFVRKHPSETQARDRCGFLYTARVPSCTLPPFHSLQFPVISHLHTYVSVILLRSLQQTQKAKLPSVD